ncbi:MAG TPA: hemerythrin domain-containing protein [Rhizomicrobium sp.]|jgi:iron-sulfur cluster repair protein YtfE (RIC family)
MDLEHTARKAGRTVGKMLSPGKSEQEIDILDKLGQEHDEVEQLLAKMVESRNATERKSLLRKIKAALVPHLRAEEKVVYDAVIRAKGADAVQDGEEGYLEHALGDKILAKLGKITDARSPEFGAAAKVLKDLVQHHVEEEERNIWSDVRDNFSDEERIEMTRRFEAAKKTVRLP